MAGSGQIVSESRAVGDFDRIEIGGRFDVSVTVGGRPAVSLKGDDNLLPLVRTEVRNGALHIDSDRDLRPHDDIEIVISTAALEGISSGGSSDVRVTGVRSAGFRASVSGSSELTADGAFGDLSASVSGSGEIAMTGTADEIDARVSGSGELDLYEVRARAADVHVSGSGDVHVFVTERLNASVSGSGDVRYGGDPQVSRSVSGSGSVRPG
ncbi:MAG TPA: head GIN domain-containing protein [Gemmatimonadota bacterium]|nr:head GIN domain-containing protein [Gemmatimonadota bacterium]